VAGIEALRSFFTYRLRFAACKLQFVLGSRPSSSEGCKQAPPVGHIPVAMCRACSVTPNWGILFFSPGAEGSRAEREFSTNGRTARRVFENAGQFLSVRRFLLWLEPTYLGGKT